jgi:hypothetical protein
MSAATPTGTFHPTKREKGIMSGNSILSQLPRPGNGIFRENGTVVSNLFSVQTLLWLALLLALAGSLRHLAAMFASIDGNLFYGYLSAIAVDAGLFALSYSVRQRKAQGRSRALLWFGIVLFTTISVYGNYTYGVLATGDELAPWLVAIRPIILAASLPVLVLYLAELVSDNYHYDMASRQATIQPPAQPVETKAAAPAKTASQQQTIKAGKLAQLAALLAENPQATNTDLAAALQVSRGTIRNYRAELKAGRRADQ